MAKPKIKSKKRSNKVWIWVVSLMAMMFVTAAALTLTQTKKELSVYRGEEFCWRDPAPSPELWRCYTVTSVNPPRLTGDQSIYIVSGTSGYYKTYEDPDGNLSMFTFIVVGDHLFVYGKDGLKRK